MFPAPRMPRLVPLVAILAPAFVSACSQSMDVIDSVTTSSLGSRTVAYSKSDKECMARAMFFESHRSSREGMIAVGTVVMNRVNSDQFPNTVCGVVGQKNQFAPGVMTRAMKSKALPDVEAAAEAVLKGERHPKLGRQVKFFHQAGLTFPYKNMHYVHVAGGNAFYEKRSRRSMATQVAEAKPVPAQESVSDRAAVLAFEADQAAADKIGALLASQPRAEPAD